jgi:hypothetical protein
MRHKVDDTDLDEIHLESEETDDAFGKDMAAAPPAAPKPPASPNVTMVEAPSLRTPAAPAPVVATPDAAPNVPSEPATGESKPSGDGPAPPPANP